MTFFFFSASWCALKRLSSGQANQGVCVHWNQAVWHHVQQVSLSATYQQREGVYEYIRQLMAIPFLPLMFDHLKRKANTEQLQRLVDYIDSHWFNHAVFDVPSWSVFQQAVRTNNDVEGYNL